LAVDDDAGFLAYVRDLLEEAGYRTLTAAAGPQALKLAREELPLVVLLDIELPGLNGYEVCRALRDEFGRTLAIAFLSGTRTDQLDVSSGLLVGADDYIVKPFEPGELVARIGALARRVDAARLERSGTGENGHGLTGRELEILRLLAEGLGQNEIATGLSISPKTVATHVEHILPKLGVHSRAQAIAAAYRERLIPATG
jgi:DNA-binding NarL/FixJ family response regulator